MPPFGSVEHCDLWLLRIIVIWEVSCMSLYTCLFFSACSCSCTKESIDHISRVPNPQRETAFPNTPKHLYNICTMLDQRRRRWADVVQMLCKCFVFAGNSSQTEHLRDAASLPAQRPHALAQHWQIIVDIKVGNSTCDNWAAPRCQQPPGIMAAAEKVDAMNQRD